MDLRDEAKVFNPNQFAYMKDRSTVTRHSCYPVLTTGQNLLTREIQWT